MTPRNLTPDRCRLVCTDIEFGYTVTGGMRGWCQVCCVMEWAWQGPGLPSLRVGAQGTLISCIDPVLLGCFIVTTQTDHSHALWLLEFGREWMAMSWNGVKAGLCCLTLLQSLEVAGSWMKEMLSKQHREPRKALSSFPPLSNLNMPEYLIVKPNKLWNTQWQLVGLMELALEIDL